MNYAAKLRSCIHPAKLFSPRCVKCPCYCVKWLISVMKSKKAIELS